MKSNKSTMNMPRMMSQPMSNPRMMNMAKVTNKPMQSSMKMPQRAMATSKKMKGY